MKIKEFLNNLKEEKKEKEKKLGFFKKLRYSTYDINKNTRDILLNEDIKLAKKYSSKLFWLLFIISIFLSVSILGKQLQDFRTEVNEDKEIPVVTFNEGRVHSEKKFAKTYKKFNLGIIVDTSVERVDDLIDDVIDTGKKIEENEETFSNEDLKYYEDRKNILGSMKRGDLLTAQMIITSNEGIIYVPNSNKEINGIRFDDKFGDEVNIRYLAKLSMFNLVSIYFLAIPILVIICTTLFSFLFIRGFAKVLLVVFKGMDKVKLTYEEINKIVIYYSSIPVILYSLIITTTLSNLGERGNSILYVAIILSIVSMIINAKIALGMNNAISTKEKTKKKGEENEK